MSSRDRAKKRQARQTRKAYAKPSLPRMIGANDNHANDNAEFVVFTQEPGVKETPGQRIFRQMLRRALDERPLPARSYDPARLTPDQEKQLRRAEDRLKSDDPRRVAAAREEIEKLAESVRARIEAHERAAEKEETRKLEALRGSVIGKPGRNEPPDRITILTRDGLRSLTRSWTDRATGETMPPALDPGGTLYGAALRYRADYEAIDPERLLTPPQMDPAKVTVRRDGSTWDDKRREIEQRLFRTHLMIAGVEPQANGRGAMPLLPPGHPAMRSIHALVEIAGKGRSLSDMTTSGSVKARIRADLIRALEVCEVVYGLA